MRRLYRTTHIDGTGEWLIPVLEPSESVSDELRNSLLVSAGEDGAYDAYGDERGPREPATVELDFVVSGDDADGVQAALAAMREGLGGTVKTTGRRKLWSREADGTEPRWAYSKLQSLSVAKARQHILYVPVSAELVLPDPLFYAPVDDAWLAANYYTVQAVESALVGEPIAPDLDFALFAITTSPYSFTLTNDGLATTRRIVFRLESQAANGFTNPSITNETTGQSWSSITDGATNTTILSVNCAAGLGRARVSANGGSAWLDDTINLSLGLTQAVIMELEPGDNVMTFESGGAVDTHLLCWWAAAYRD